MQSATVRAHPKPHSHQYPGPRTPVAANPKPYNPRHPEQTQLYRTEWPITSRLGSNSAVPVSSTARATINAPCAEIAYNEEDEQ